MESNLTTSAMDEIFQFSIFNKEEKPKLKPRSYNDNIQNGNLILHVTNIHSKDFKNFIESLISIGEIHNINVAIELLSQRTKIKRNDKGHLLIFFTIPYSYKFKYLYTPNISILPRNC